jgi:imidazolonepropionase-like amidohydrolase
VIRIFAIFLLAGNLSWAQESKADEVVALHVGKILTVTKGVINNGTLLIRNGKIAALGKEVVIPEGAIEIDARNQWAMPGMVDLHCHVGNGNPWGNLNDMVFPTNPGLSTLGTIQPNNENLKNAWAGGVTTVLYIPGSGTNMGGFGVLMKTGGADTVRGLILRFPGAVKVAQAWNPERRGGDLGRTRMGMWWNLRHLLTRAKAYNESWSNFEKGLTKIPPVVEPDLEKLRGVFQGKYPVIIHTADARDVMGTVRMFHDQYKLPMIISHGEFGGFRVAKEIARRGIHANIGPRIYDFAYQKYDGRFDGIPTKFRQGGVKKISINTDSPVVPQEDLWFQASMAVRLGMPAEEALAGVTIIPAQAVMADHRVGSLEVGKDADIVLKTGGPFDIRSYVTMTMINGRIVYDLRRDKRRY